MVCRTAKTARARPGQDDIVRLAGERRQSLPRPKSGVTSRSRSAILRLNQRRWLVFSDSGVDTAAQLAVSDPVKEINRETDREPGKETDPGLERQTQHQEKAKDHAENWKQRHQRNTKRSRPACFGSSQDNDTDANKNKGEERSDIGQVGERTDINYGGNTADENAGPDRCNVRRPKLRMNFCKILRKQTIARHRHENARLAKLEHEKD